MEDPSAEFIKNQDKSEEAMELGKPGGSIPFYVMGVERETYHKHLCDQMEKYDLWASAGKEAKRDDLPPQDAVWFAHPVYFLNHLDEAGLINPEFNPYEKYSPLIVDGYPSIIVESNPGFGTYFEKNTNNDARIKYSDEGNPGGNDNAFWGRINVPANQNYLENDFHYGVDISAAGMNALIMATIYGTVWACTYDKAINNTYKKVHGLGRCMAIKGDNGILYILGHLTDYNGLTVGQNVEPRMVVAHAGNTGHSQSVHLHLEARKCDYEDRGKVFDEKANQSYTTIADQGKIYLSGTEIAKGFKFLENIDSNMARVNPFNHKEPVIRK